MELGERDIKALASDTRVRVMKSLASRRKMPSELSRELSLAPSTIVEHLQVLEHSGLVRSVETGHKWIYYELTEKGRNLTAPKWPMQFVVMLSLGVLLVFSSMNFSYVGIGEIGAGVPLITPAANPVVVPERTMGTAVDGQQNASDAMGAPAGPTPLNPPPQKLPDLVSPATVVFILGAGVIIISSWRLLKAD